MLAILFNEWAGQHLSHHQIKYLKFIVKVKVKSVLFKMLIPSSTFIATLK